MLINEYIKDKQEIQEKVTLPLICQLHSFLFWFSSESVLEPWDSRVLMIAWTSLALKFILVYFSKSGIVLHQQEDAIFEEYPKISHVDMRKIFTRELIIYSFWGNSMSSHYDIQPNINIMASSECTQNELEVKIRFHCNISSSLLYLPLTAFLKLASTF